MSRHAFMYPDNVYLFRQRKDMLRQFPCVSTYLDSGHVFRHFNVKMCLEMPRECSSVSSYVLAMAHVSRYVLMLRQLLDMCTMSTCLYMSKQYFDISRQCKDMSKQISYD